MVQKWKFLLLGITGDLSKRKILPALAKFAELEKESLSIELLGYSRSIPDLVEINSILDSNTTTGKSFISQIINYQAEYNDEIKLTEIINTLSPDERLVVYLAVPPYLIADILKNFCLFDQRNFDILIEKPFGQSLQEAENIFNIIDNCDLRKKTFFLDHALFKSALYPTNEAENALLPFKGIEIESISIHWLEDLDVKGRGGYYDQNGAIKDMLPSHIISLLYRVSNTFNLGRLNLEEDITISSVEIAQYESYLNDIEQPSSTTDTYFLIKGMINHESNSINFSFESGKKLNIKKTFIEIKFRNGQIITWDISNTENGKYLEINDNEKLKRYTLAEGNYQNEHVNTFKDLLDFNFQRFFTKEMVIDGWGVYNKVLEFIETNNITVRKYRDDEYPIQVID